MTTLLIANMHSDCIMGDLGGLTADQLLAVGNTDLRLAWLLEPGDVMVHAQPVDPHFLDYVAGVRGVDPAELTVVVPEPRRDGTAFLTDDRILDERLVARLRDLVREHGIDRVLPATFDRTVARLVDLIGLPDTPPGYGFFEQDGSVLVNSKVAFRALAAGVGVPIAAGTVTDSPTDAAAYVSASLDAGEAVIVKQDLHMGGRGNEILARHDLRQIGASDLTLLATAAEVSAHCAARWDRYSAGGRNRVVLEHYHPDALPLGSEVLIDESGVELRNVCEMRMRPVVSGMVLPGMEVTGTQLKSFSEAVLAISEPVRAIGYRGYMNIDGIVATDGRVLLTEFNGRLGGTTHLDAIARLLLGSTYLDEALLVTGHSWRAPSFRAALRALTAAGLAYNPATRTGVLLTCDNSRQSGIVEYCIVAPGRAAMEYLEQAVLALTFPASA